MRRKLGRCSPMPARNIRRCLYAGDHGSGAETGVHHHPGPEVLYTVTGEECMETEQGKFAGRPGGPAVIVPAGVQHRLTITGTEERTSLSCSSCMTRPNRLRSGRMPIHGHQRNYVIEPKLGNGRSICALSTVL